jgi:hypothetical protein
MTYYPKNATAKERLKAYVEGGKLKLADQLYELIMTLEERFEMTATPEIEEDDER